MKFDLLPTNLRLSTDDIPELSAEEILDLARQMEAGRRRLLAILCDDTKALGRFFSRYNEAASNRSSWLKFVEVPATKSFQSPPKIEREAEKKVEDAKLHSWHIMSGKIATACARFISIQLEICARRGPVSSDPLPEYYHTKKKELIDLLLSQRPKDKHVGKLIEQLPESPTAHEAQKAWRALNVIKSTLAKTNTRLVKSVARRFLYTGRDLADIANDGFFGLLKAIDKFDVRLGYTFSTYATWWITSDIIRAIARDTTVRLPNYISTDILRLHRAVEKMADNSQRRDPEKIAEATGFPLAKVEALLDIIHNRATISLQDLKRTSKDGQDDLTLETTLADTKTVDPHQTILQEQMNNALIEALATLNPKEELILRRRFGLSGNGDTLQTIGDDFGVSRERIRQIENRGLRKLRERHGRVLAPFWNSPALRSNNNHNENGGERPDGRGRKVLNFEEYPYIVEKLGPVLNALKEKGCHNCRDLAAKLSEAMGVGSDYAYLLSRKFCKGEILNGDKTDPTLTRVALYIVEDIAGLSIKDVFTRPPAKAPLNSENTPPPAPALG